MHVDDDVTINSCSCSQLYSNLFSFLMIFRKSYRSKRRRHRK